MKQIHTFAQSIFLSSQGPTRIFCEVQMVNQYCIYIDHSDEIMERECSAFWACQTEL